MTALDACHAARQAWQKTQSQLDIFSVLNEQPAPALSHGLLVEGRDPVGRPLTAAECAEGPSLGSAGANTRHGEYEPSRGSSRPQLHDEGEDTK